MSRVNAPGAPGRDEVAAPRESAPAFELLESKLHAPHGHGHSVSRAKLIARLERASARPIVVVSAGTGWGKTTLLTQWASESERPFAWVGVDERDNDPIVLLTYVAVALDRVSPLDHDVFDALATPGVSVEATIVPRMGASLARLEHPLVLVLDDLHLLDSAPCLDAIAALARHVPEGTQMALAAREGPALPLGALRARGLTTDVGPDELRMNEAEAGQLLHAAGVDLPDEQVAELTARTEGWAAGLYLAALSIRAGGVTAERAARFSGRDPLMSDYLRSEALAHESADDLRFLTRTAVLEQMSGPLCDAVLEQSGSAARLELLARSNHFVVNLDRDGAWYRYRHLFQELLRAELARAEPELLPLLLARATAWCEANGQLETAIGYAQAAGDVDRAAWLIERCALPAYQSGRVATAERWLDWLEGHGGLERHAAITVLAALLNSVWGRTARAERLTAMAERASHEGRLPDGSASIDSWRALLRAQRCCAGVASMRADAERAVRTLAPESPDRPNALLLLAISEMLVGELDEADDRLADAIEAGLDLNTPETAAVALAERAAIALGREAWVRAEELVNHARRLIHRSRMDAYPTSALTYALAARVALHRGETATAHELLAQAQALRPRLTYALPYLAVQTRLELARSYLTLADAPGAETMQREIDLILRRQPDLGVLSAEAQELRANLSAIHADVPGASSLTEAELRVLPSLATHLTFREIGARLYVSHHTVKSHAMAIYRKLGASSRTEAVERAREIRLL